MASKEVPAAIKRLMEVTSRIREDIVQKAIRTVLERHGLKVDRIEKPLLKYSDRSVLNEHTGRLYSGTTGESDVTLYAPGIEERVALGGAYELVVLNVYLHERTHYLVGDKKRPKRTSRVNGIEFESHTEITGFQLKMLTVMPEAFLPRVIGSRAFMFFNEGVTECFAREIMDVYLQLDPHFSDLPAARVRKHRKGLAEHAPFAFYGIAVDFVQTFTKVLAHESGDMAGEWAGLYGDYFACTNLLTNRSWQERFLAIGIDKTMQKVSGCYYSDLGIHADSLRRLLMSPQEAARDCGVWQAVTVESRGAASATASR